LILFPQEGFSSTGEAERGSSLTGDSDMIQYNKRENAN
jgi:hypothetical protein